ncbi:glycosyltransferase family 2 protein [Roseibacillus ishigakijimensis]|uniref:Glycosyltransferase family 2 protein n=1 Tax=Roseibacillus ishigakijimensis TaxID=454146 RepID=A0A934VLN2_9BACT|nr:glycosyltransferase family A protein [Roseibacillus ishigakijimensis]MBK1833417.1 glycosyltransferase family 2 protein [Roseibacillus ishigakijimensis]
MNSQVSIIIPLFNREDLIGETLESIQAQSYQNWEALVVDDGSTDGSRAVVEGFGERDKRVRLLEWGEAPKGACSCRNKGLQEAQGEFVIFLDSDDLLTPDALARRVEALAAAPALDFTVSGTVIFDSKIGDVSRYLCFPHETDCSDTERFFLFDHPWLTTGPTWRRSFLQENHLQWRENLDRWQDLFFHLDCLAYSPVYQRLAGYDNGWRRDAPDKITRLKNVEKESLLVLLSALKDIELRKEQGPLYEKNIAVVYSAFSQAFRARGVAKWLDELSPQEGGLLVECYSKSPRHRWSLSLRSRRFANCLTRVIPPSAEQRVEEKFLRRVVRKRRVM